MYDTRILDLDHENDFELIVVIAELIFSTDYLGFSVIKRHLYERG